MITHLQQLILLSRPTLPSFLPPSTTYKQNWKKIHTCTPVLPDAPPIRLLFLRNLGLEWVKCFLLLEGTKRKPKWVAYPREWLNQLDSQPESKPPSPRTGFEFILAEEGVAPPALALGPQAMGHLWQGEPCISFLAEKSGKGIWGKCQAQENLLNGIWDLEDDGDIPWDRSPRP